MFKSPYIEGSPNWVIDFLKTHVIPRCDKIEYGSEYDSSIGYRLYLPDKRCFDITENYALYEEDGYEEWVGPSFSAYDVTNADEYIAVHNNNEIMNEITTYLKTYDRV